MTERPILFSGPMVRSILAGRKTQTRRVVKPQPRDGADVRLATADGSRRLLETWVDQSTGREFSALTARCPYGQPGDRLWVRETFTVESNLGIDSIDGYPPPFDDGRPVEWHAGDGTEYDEPYWTQAHYRATDPAPDICCESPRCAACRDVGYGPHWKPSIHMPRWASRLTLDVTAVGVERLQEMTFGGARLRSDASREGAPPEVEEAVANGGLTAEEDWFIPLWDSINAKRGHSWESNPWVWVIEFEVEQ